MTAARAGSKAGGMSRRSRKATELPSEAVMYGRLDHALLMRDP